MVPTILQLVDVKPPKNPDPEKDSCIAEEIYLSEHRLIVKPMHIQDLSCNEQYKNHEFAWSDIISYLPALMTSR